MEPVNVIFIAGCGRSGTTLLDNVLGQAEGCFSSGEMWHIWRRGLVENRLCGDGIPFRSHPFWQEVFERGFGGMDSSSLRLDLLLKQESSSLSVATHYPRLALGGIPHESRQAEHYIDAIGRLYRATAAASQCRYLIDSSKYPVYALQLSRVPGIKVHVLHLVRDPRAVVYSWRRHKPQPDKAGTMDRHGMLWSTLQWRMANAAAESLQHSCGLSYRRLRYEDLVSSPRRTIGDIGHWLELPGAQRPFRSDNEVVLQGNCAFSGNPSRFQRGVVTLALDDEWKRCMPAWRRAFVGNFAGPGFSRYGYSVNAVPAITTEALRAHDGK